MRLLVRALALILFVTARAVAAPNEAVETVREAETARAEGGAAASAPERAAEPAGLLLLGGGLLAIGRALRARRSLEVG